MFLAVHELEAWLLSDPGIFPAAVCQRLKNDHREPEKVNFDRPPSKYLKELYLSSGKTGYKKTTEGKKLFSRLNPDLAHGECPHLAQMLDEMLRLAKEAGL